MAITVVSPASGGSPLAALTGSTTETGTESSGFSALFGQLLAGKKGPAEMDDVLSKDITDPMHSLTGMDSDRDAALTGALPAEIQALLNSKLTRKSTEAEEQPSDTDILAAPLQAQVETRTTPTLKNSRQEIAAAALSGQSNSRATEQALVSHNPANLAATTTEEPGPVTQLLHSLPGTAQGSTQTQQTQSTLPELRTPLHDTSRWSQEFGEKIVWMARNDQQQAQLNLNPAHLGPLRITLNMDADQASAVFTATTPEVRQAIEDAMPRLREMLANAGISLGHTQVGTQSQQEQAKAQEGRGSARASKDGAILEADTASSAPVVQRRGIGMVDLFA